MMPVRAIFLTWMYADDGESHKHTTAPMPSATNSNGAATPVRCAKTAAAIMMASAAPPTRVNWWSTRVKSMAQWRLRHVRA